MRRTASGGAVGAVGAAGAVGPGQHRGVFRQE